MTVNITVRDSADSPFGDLANDANVPFKCDGDDKMYPSVVNYVYYNMLPESSLKEELATANPRSVIDIYHKVNFHLKQSIIQSAMHHAISEKAKQYRRFYDCLIHTNDSKIVYYSNNGFLGYSSNLKKGDNVYGQVLQQVRNELRRDRQSENVAQIGDRTVAGRIDNDVYLAYVAEINLKKALHKYDLERYVVKSGNRSMKQLVKMLEADFGKTEIRSKIPDVQTVLALHEKRNIVNYSDPNSLIRIVRKNEIRNVLRKNTFDFKNYALAQFVNYTVAKNNTLSVDKTRYIDALPNMLMSKRERFADRVVDLYSARALPVDLMNKIHKYRSERFFPTTEQIEFFETEKVKVPNMLVVERNTANDDSIYAVKNDRSDVLSPMHQFPLTLSNRTFPSISHYTAYELVRQLHYGRLRNNDLYKRLKNVRLSDLDDFVSMAEKVHKSDKNMLLEKAIVAKLKNNHIKNLLFSVQTLSIHDDYGLEDTQKFYDAHKDKVILETRKISSFEQFVVKDPFILNIVKTKVDFYFTILDNLMVHASSKKCRSVNYDDMVRMMPFTFSGTKDRAVDEHDSTVPSPERVPEYLAQKISAYGMSYESAASVWEVVFASMRQCDKIIRDGNVYDVRYRSLMTWATYFLGRSVVAYKDDEDVVLTALMAILTDLKNLNASLGCLVMNDDDLQTAVHLCLGSVRPMNRTSVVNEPLRERLEDYDYEDAQTEEEPVLEEDDDSNRDYYAEDDDPDFEGFDMAGRKKFDALLKVHFNPLKNETIDLSKLERAVARIVRSKVNKMAKNRFINFFKRDFEIMVD